MPGETEPYANKIPGLDKIEIKPKGDDSPTKPEQKSGKPKKKGIKINPPPKSAIGAPEIKLPTRLEDIRIKLKTLPPSPKEKKPEQKIENVDNFTELYNFLNKTNSGRSVSYEIIGLINNARELSAHDKFVRYIKFMAKLDDPALKRVLNKFLITNDPALSQVQKEEDEKRKQEEKANFSIEDVVAQHIRNLKGMKVKKRKDYINETLTKVFHTQEEYPGFFEALNAAYTKFLELEAKKTHTEPVTPLAEGESERTIKKLRKTIEKNSAIIADARKELEEIENRIAKKKTQTSEPKEGESKEKITNSEKIGNYFVEFCKNPENLIHFDFDTFTKSLTAISDVKAKIVFRTTSAQEPFFLEIKPESSYSKGILVNIGSENYLLPYPLDEKQFDTLIESFNYNTTSCIPSKLQKIIPAELILKGKRWDIKTPGQLI